jgi:hypothetical protein
MTDKETRQIDNIFTYHAPGGTQQGRYEALRGYAKVFATATMECCPDSRERSLAITAIQQAVMWANASIACHEVAFVPTPNAVIDPPTFNSCSSDGRRVPDHGPR